MSTMKGAVIEEYGPPETLKYRDIERPQPGPGELLLRVKASSVNPVDCNVRRGAVKLVVHLKMPAVLGIDFCGEVVERGEGARSAAEGDALFGWAALNHCGAYAEYIAIKESWARPKPRALTHEEAAALAGAGVTAIQALRTEAKLQPGEEVLVVGASGGVGTAAVQIAKAMGASVVAVCGTANVDLVQRLGATRVIDYKKSDPLTDAQRFDVVVDCVGQNTFWDCRHLLKRHGRHVVVPFSPRHFLYGLLGKVDPNHSSHWFFSNPNPDDLEYLRTLAESGAVKPVIAKVYPLAEVAAAHRESETGRVVGKIVLAV